MAKLYLLGEDGAVAESWDLAAKPVAIGRGAAADVIVEDVTLSRRHFLIVREGTDYILKDLNSQNGTWVDGKRAHSTRLRHHDCIVAGRTLFLFSEQPASGNATDLATATAQVAGLSASVAARKMAESSVALPSTPS